MYYIYTILWIINHHLKCTPKPILPIASLNLSAPMTQEPLSQDTPVVVSQAEARGDGAFLYGILSKNDGMGKSWENPGKYRVIPLTALVWMRMVI